MVEHFPSFSLDDRAFTQLHSELGWESNHVRSFSFLEMIFGWINHFLPLAWYTATGNMGDGARVGTRELDKGRLGFIELLFDLTLGLNCSLKHSQRILKAVSSSLQEKKVLLS